MFDKAVMHGGTAIWRCYHGNRFSEDVDMYIPKDNARIEQLFEHFKKQGFIVEKKKIGEQSIYSDLIFNRVHVSFEAVFKKPMPKGSLAEYESADGNYITIYTLTPEELIQEKVNAYTKRLKIRDLFDVYFLMRYIKDKSVVAPMLKKLINNFKEPIDSSDLKILIIEGLTPKTEEMYSYLERCLNG